MPTRREISDHMRSLIAEVRRALDDLSYDPKALTQGHASSGTVIRTKAGSLVGQVVDESAVMMIIQGPRWLKILAGYVERIEREAYETRRERRRFRMVAQALYDAENAGIGTPIGRRHIDLALARLHPPDDVDL